MRRFFHRKASQTPRPTLCATANNGQLGTRPRSSSSSSSNSPVHGPLVAANTPATASGRVRAPALRSRSMSVLNGPSVTSGTARKFTRSLSFCAEQNPTISERPSCLITRQMTKSEEDEVFRTYTRRVYGMFGALCAVIAGLAVYAYLYNYGNR